MNFWTPRTHPAGCLMLGKCGFNDCGLSRQSLRLPRNQKSHQGISLGTEYVIRCRSPGDSISPSSMVIYCHQQIRTPTLVQPLDSPSQKPEAQGDDLTCQILVVELDPGTQYLLFPTPSQRSFPHTRQLHPKFNFFLSVG